LGPSRHRRKDDGSGSAAAVAHSVYELGVVRGRAEWGKEEWREQLLCVLETPDISRNRRRGEGQPADAGGDPNLTDGSVAAWRGSMITPGDWLSCCGGGVVRRGGGLLPGGTLRLLDRGCGRGGPGGEQ